MFQGVAEVMSRAGAYQDEKEKRNVFFKDQAGTVLNSWIHAQTTLYIFYYHSI